MTDYAIIKNSTSLDVYLVQRILTTEQDQTGRWDFIDLTGISPQPQVGDYYTMAGGFSATIPAAATANYQRTLEPVEFWMGRFTDDERGIIYALAAADGGGVTLTIMQRGRLRAFLALTAANQVMLDHKETIFVINALETVGALGAGRAAEILA